MPSDSLLPCIGKYPHNPPIIQQARRDRYDVGIAELVKRHPHLEDPLMNFAEEITPSKLGSWIIGTAAWASSIKQATLVQRWQTLVKKWESDGSAELSKTARAIASVKKSKK